MHCQSPNTASVAAVGGVPLAVTLHSSGQEGWIPSGPSLVMWWHQVGKHVEGPKLQLLQSSHTRMSSKNWFHQAVRFVPHPVEAQKSSH